MWVCFWIILVTWVVAPNDRIEGKLADDDVSLIDCSWWIVFLKAALIHDHGVRR